MNRGGAHRSTDSVGDWGSLPSIPTSINGASYHLADAKSPQERLIASLVRKIRNEVRYLPGMLAPMDDGRILTHRTWLAQLPYISGRTIIQLEIDPSLQHIVETLVDAGKERLDRVAWSLSELLHNVFNVCLVWRNVAFE